MSDTPVTPSPAAPAAPPPPQRWHALIPGLFALGLGLFFLSHTLGWLATPWRYLPLWPWAFIVLIGLLKMSRGNAHDVIVGLLISLFGGALIMQTLGYWHDIWRFWPVLLIAAGVLLLVEANQFRGGNTPVPAGYSGCYNHAAWRAQRRAWREQRRAAWRAQWQRDWNRRFSASAWPTGATVNATANPASRENTAGNPAAEPDATTGSPADSAYFTPAAGPHAAADSIDDDAGWLHMEAYFSENKRRVVTPGFRAGHIVAVFGACRLDLRAAPQPPGTKLLIEANVVFGEIQIYVPSHWKVSVRGAGIFGNFQDDTLPPVTPLASSDIRLEVYGTSAFGQVSVRN